MRKIIEGLKEQREKAEKTFIKNCLIKRASLVNSAIPDTESYLDDVCELNEAISKQKGQLQVRLSPKVFEILRKALGEFEIVI